VRSKRDAPTGRHDFRWFGTPVASRERPDLVLITHGDSMTGVRADPAKPKLLQHVRDAIRARHYARRTERAYVVG
jgi:hypothetical protein